MILGGGPSLKNHVADIERLIASGAKLVTLNGAYHFALEHGWQVGSQIVVDARPFNKRFVEPVQPKLQIPLGLAVRSIALRCVPADMTYQWHTTAEFIHEALTEVLPVWFGVPGGSTVFLRAIPLLLMLGFKSFHVFGCDSCLVEDAHHAYAQPENDEHVIIPAIVGGRVFRCYAWQVSQASEFIELVKRLGDEVQMEFYGDGLLAWIVQHACNVDIETEQQALTA